MPSGLAGIGGGVNLNTLIHVPGAVKEAQLIAVALRALSVSTTHEISGLSTQENVPLQKWVLSPVAFTREKSRPFSNRSVLSDFERDAGTAILLSLWARDTSVEEIGA